MSLPDPLSDLLSAGAYPHPCDAIEVTETHISWVILTGEFAYKVKKPVRFAFVDFSTVDLRAHFCGEELRCNRRFAPSLYLDVVSIGIGASGRLEVGGSQRVVEWAVKMRQFDPQAQLDRMLSRGAVTRAMLTRFGATLAARHGGLPVLESTVEEELQERVLAPVEDNYRDVMGLDWAADCRALLERSRAQSHRQVERHRELLVRRLEDGWIRECHGDLHLSNLVLLEDGVTAFDCLEFSPTLRWIDPVSDVAFLFMDCMVRDRADLAYAFLDGYLDAGGDYQGATLLPFYAAYRSMVRAKVAALRREQAEGSDKAVLTERFRRHVGWAADWLGRGPGGLVLMCGLTGSGKSYLAERLVPWMGAVRLRSDVARKALAGLTPRTSARAEVGGGLYDAGSSHAVYRWLLELAGDLLESGEQVIVDATFLEAARRAPFLALAADLGHDAVILHCDAPEALLEKRVRERDRSGQDPSDAGLAVLDHQRQVFDPPGEQVLRIDTRESLDVAALEALARKLVRGGTRQWGA